MDERDLRARLAEHADRHGVPGALVGVLSEGGWLLAAHGLADVRTGVPVTVHTRFSVGSLTKSLLAAAVALVAAEGRMDFEERIVSYVPELRGAAWARDTTLRDLLANRSPVPLCARLDFGFVDHPGTDDGALSRLVAEAAGEPGNTSGAWSYSNLGWCVVGRALEVVLDRPWEAAMRTALEPAGLSDTAFGRDIRPGRASGHDVTAAGPAPVAPLASRAYGPAGANTTSTVADLLRFAELHLTHPALLQLREVQSTLSISGWLDSWCLGWAGFEWEGGTVWGWEGIVNGERAAFRLLPADRAAVVVLTNGSTGRAVHRSLLADLGPMIGNRPPPLGLSPRVGAAGDLSRFAGAYAWPDHRVEVEVLGDCLRLTTAGRSVEALPVDDRTFVIDAADPDAPSATFGFGRDGQPAVLYEQIWGLPRQPGTG